MDRKCIYTAFYIQEYSRILRVHSFSIGGSFWWYVWDHHPSSLWRLCYQFYSIYLNMIRQYRSMQARIHLVLLPSSERSFRRLWQVMQFNLDCRLLFFISIILINGSRIFGALLTHWFTLCPPGLLAPAKQLPKPMPDILLAASPKTPNIWSVWKVRIKAAVIVALNQFCNPVKYGNG